jgi:hypothetical protein
MVYGAANYELEYRLMGTDDCGVVFLSTNRYDTSWVLDGWEYVFRIRSRYGDSFSDWSEPVSVVYHSETPQAELSPGLASHRHRSGCAASEWHGLPPPYTVGTGPSLQTQHCSYSCSLAGLMPSIIQSSGLVCHPGGQRVR